MTSAAPPKPKRKPATVAIYNASRKQKVTLPDGVKLQPGQTARVPAAWGKAMIERIFWIRRAERGDTMD